MVKNTLIWFRALYVFGSILVVPPIVGGIVAGIVYGINALGCWFSLEPVRVGTMSQVGASTLGIMATLFTAGLLIYNLVNEWTAIKAHIAGKKE